MADKPSRKEWHYFFNNMVLLVRALEGVYTVIDLRNEACVSGKIESVDGFMNVNMLDAIFTDQRGDEHELDMFFVPGRMIRYVHIPDEISIVPAMVAQMEAMKRKPQQQARLKDTWRGRKLMKQQAETLLQVQQLKKGHLDEEESEQHE